MKIPAPVFRVLNPLVKGLLASPLHGLLSRDVMLVTFTGRRSGRRFTTPVSYLREGDRLCFFTERSGRWWRNLRGGVPVELLVRGERLAGRAEAIADDPKRVADALHAFLRQLPRDAAYHDIRLDSQGEPPPEQLERAAARAILVEVLLEERPGASA